MQWVEAKTSRQELIAIHHVELSKPAPGQHMMLVTEQGNSVDNGGHYRKYVITQHIWELTLEFRRPRNDTLDDLASTSTLTSSQQATRSSPATFSLSSGRKIFHVLLVEAFQLSQALPGQGVIA